MRRSLLAIAFLFFIPQLLVSATIVLDFESFVDGDLITTQIQGLTFTNTVVLTAGISLNEFDFPPHSGFNVISDNGGPIGIAFDNPVASFKAYFTYLEPLSLFAFDSSNAQVGQARSLFSNNTGTAGDFGSSPNEPLEVAFAGGIRSVSIAGDPAGGSFVLDDVVLTTGEAAIPEPRTLWMNLTGIGLVALLFRRRRLTFR